MVGAADSVSVQAKPALRLGLIVNPLAGIGGPAAQKGSDGSELQAAAAAGQYALTSPSRARTFLQLLQPFAHQFELWTVPGAMGERVAREASLNVNLIDYVPGQPTNGHDTERAAGLLAKAGMDLIVFVGGDGTARDVCRALDERQLVLGVPAGVKMHSSVYAVNPQAAAEVVQQILAGELVSVNEGEVRDIDEEAFRAGLVKSRWFGTLQVPDEARYIQQVKQGGVEVEALVLDDIAADIAEWMTDDLLTIFGPGSTTQQVLQNLGRPSTLLGIDLFLGDRLLKPDATANDIEESLNNHNGPVALFITAIGGQGHIIGRGNQQLTAEVLQRIGRDNLHVIATRTKLKNLQNRPLLMDSGDPVLDKAWGGYISVLTGYHDRVLYPIGLDRPAADSAPETAPCR